MLQRRDLSMKKKKGFHVRQTADGKLKVFAKCKAKKGWDMIASLTLKGVSGDTLLAWYDTVTSSH